MRINIMPQPLALNDTQLDTIHVAAGFVRVEQRPQFLRSVADALIGIEVTDASIANAVETVLGQWVLGASCCSE
jgi:hypothetical protein